MWTASRLRPSPRLFRSPIPRPFRQRRTLIAAPKENSGPLLERRSDRELPALEWMGQRWFKSAPIFVVILIASAAGLFNYQKQSSSVVTSSMYALRTSTTARKVLGDEIYFKHSIPWIWGEINQLQGRIDINYSVKGTKGQGQMRFKSTRRKRLGQFAVDTWTLETDDGQVINLLETAESDPFTKQPM